jgi:hypothetical protein
MDQLRELSIKLEGKIRKQDLLNINFKDISTRELIIKNYRDFKINIDEFGKLYQISIDTGSDLMFAINQPEKIFKIDQPLKIPDFPYDIYILEEQYNPFLNNGFDKFWDLFSLRVKEIKLTKNESIFVDGYRICLILESNRNVIPILDDIIELIRNKNSLFSKYKPHRIYKKNIPDNLKPLFPLLKKWSVSDDDLRGQLVEESSERQQKKLINIVYPFMNEINKFLDSFKGQPLSEEAVLIGNLAELVSELQLNLSPGDVSTLPPPRW